MRSNLLVAFGTWASLVNSSWGAYPNHKIVVTDVLDDDLRAIVNLMTDPKTKDTVSAFVVSTGNTELKSEVLRQVLTSLGHPKIPVLAGTSTNLNANSVTAFAGNFELEGKHILPEDVRSKLLGSSKSGSAPQEIIDLLAKSQGRTDFLLLTAPTDIVAAYKADPAILKQKAGDLISMGLYKEVTKDGSPHLVAPYNAMADPYATRSLFDILGDGVFQNHYHVPSDTVQLRSGLPGGYFPSDEAGKALKLKLGEIMSRNEGLKAIFTAAKEYGHSWRDYATRVFGVGLNNYDRWVPSSFTNPSEAAGFYFADTIPTVMSNYTTGELAKLTIQERQVMTPSIADPTKSFEFQISPNGRRAVKDVVSFDGMSILTHYFSQLEEWSQHAPKPTLVRQIASKTSDSSLPPSSGKVSTAFESDGRPRALVMTVKNSPDDWFALVKTVSTPAGREALQRGGVIAEGFEPTTLARAVHAVLTELGIKDVPIAVGYAYSPGEVDSIPNFNGERTLYRENQGYEAFGDLLKKYANDPKARSKAPSEVLEGARQWTAKNNGLIDLVILGEGIDSSTIITENKANYGGRIGNVYVMGGGRLGASGKFVLTRNWAREGSKALEKIRDLSSLNDGRVFAFSSDQFGGALIARGEPTPQQAATGNAVKVQEALESASIKSRAVKAITRHWENWSRVFSQIGGVLKGEPFQPKKAVDVLTISPLALHIQDAWQLNQGASLPKDWNSLIVDPVKLAKSGDFPDPKKGVTWFFNLENSVSRLAQRFSDALLGIPRNTGVQSDAPRSFSTAGKPRALVMTFKNSPDDWFALLKTVSTPEGRDALRHGGVIAEGFQTSTMARAVRAVLLELGIADVPLAVGHAYAAGEVDAIPNFGGERILYQENQGFQAFEELMKKHRVELERPAADVNAVLENSRLWAEKTGGLIDLIFLGEGTDTLETVSREKLRYANLLGNAYVMGGGRSDSSGNFILTRNWAREKGVVLSRLKELSQMNGGKVFVFSSDQFGGSLVARGEPAAEQVSTGNAVKIQKALGAVTNRSEAVAAVSKHWENWSRIFGQLGDVLKGQPFQPQKPVPVLTISPLALHIQDAWQFDRGASPPSSWRTVIVDPDEIAATGKLMDPKQGINWLINKNPSVQKLSENFSQSLGNLQTDQDAQTYHDVVRQRGPFASEATAVRENVESKSSGTCRRGIFKRLLNLIN